MQHCTHTGWRLAAFPWLPFRPSPCPRCRTRPKRGIGRVCGLSRGLPDVRFPWHARSPGRWAIAIYAASPWAGRALTVHGLMQPPLLSARATGHWRTRQIAKPRSLSHCPTLVAHSPRSVGPLGRYQVAWLLPATAARWKRQAAAGLLRTLCAIHRDIFARRIELALAIYP
ncbi:hypothetical protein C8Q76DRAFT_854666 [Earliella scabrosa]|nr:hypothetical protein C8Q76DRAFT_854666 [Earliella scabrosa]